MTAPRDPSNERARRGAIPLSRVVAGDGCAAPGLSREEFESMATPLIAPLTVAARAYTGNEGDADDVVQDTLFRAYRSLHTFQRGTNFRGWLFRILYNAASSRWNGEARAPIAVDPADFDVAAADHPVPDLRAVSEYADVAEHHFDERVKWAVDGLPLRYRNPFILYSLGGMRYAEIAEALGVPVGTVMSRLHRARHMLYETLIEYARERGYASGGDT